MVDSRIFPRIQIIIIMHSVSKLYDEMVFSSVNKHVIERSMFGMYERVFHP